MKINYSELLNGVEARMRFDFPDMDDDTLGLFMEEAKTTCLDIVGLPVSIADLKVVGGYLRYYGVDIPRDLKERVSHAVMARPMILNYKDKAWLVVDLELNLLCCYPQKGDVFGPVAQDLIGITLIRVDLVDFDSEI